MKNKIVYRLRKEAENIRRTQAGEEIEDYYIDLNTIANLLDDAANEIAKNQMYLKKLLEKENDHE